MGWFCCFMFGSDDSISNLLGFSVPLFILQGGTTVTIESATKFMMKLSRLPSCI